MKRKYQSTIMLISIMLLMPMSSGAAKGQVNIEPTNLVPNTTASPTATPVSEFTDIEAPLEGVYGGNVAWGDYDNDHHLDALISGCQVLYNCDPSIVRLYHNQNGITFNDSGIYFPVSIIAGAVWMDYNNDGWLDILTYSCDRYCGTPYNSLYRNNGDGTFTEVSNTGLNNIFIRSAVWGDYNNDHYEDVFIPSGRNTNGCTGDLYRNNGDATFTSTNICFAASSAVAGEATWADFNNDGFSDLMVFVGTQVVTYRNNHDNTFTAIPLPTTSGIGEGHAAVADYDHDGKLDVVVFGYDPNQNDMGVLNFFHNTGNTFQLVDFGLGSGGFSGLGGYVSWGDFDGDSYPDLLLTGYLSNYGGPRTALYHNNAGGSFSEVNTSLINVARGETAWGDFNNDGRVDILLSGCTPACSPSVTKVFRNDPYIPPSPTPQPTVCANPFVDISTNIFFHAINSLNCQGVINGTDASHYTPGGTATRGQFAKIVTLAFALPLLTPTGGQTFTDVPPNYYAYVYIESGYAAGILNGFDPGTCQANNAIYPCYLPNQAITRDQLTKLVVNAAGYPLLTPSNGPSFSDVPPDSFFYAYIETARANHVINGYPDGTFRPHNNIRRDEMAQIVYTAQQNPATSTATPTNTPSPSITNTDTPLPTVTPNDTTTPITSLTPTPVITDTYTPLPTDTITPTDTATPTLTPTP